MENVGLTKFKRCEKNPFIEGMTITSRNKMVASSKYSLPGISKKDKKGDVEQLFLYMRKEVDSKQFVKLYKDNIQFMFSLKQNAQKVFGYFMDKAEMNKDIIYFSDKECMKHSGYKAIQSIYTGLAELLNKKFIARGDKPNKYFINPEVFFNGDRFVVVKDFWKKSAVKRLNDKNQLELFEDTGRDKQSDSDGALHIAEKTAERF